MNTESLIQDLVNQHRAVKPLRPLWLRLHAWIFIATLCVATGVFLIEPRADWASALLRPPFVSQLVVLFTIAATAALSAFRLSVPGRDIPSTRFLAWLIIAAWATWLIGTAVIVGDFHAGIGWGCVRNIVLLGFLPGLLLGWSVKKAAPLDAKRLAFFSLLSTTALACAGTRLICPHDNPLHFFVWHCLPMLGMSLAGLLLSIFLGKKS